MFYFYLYAAKNAPIWCRSKFQSSSTFQTRYFYDALFFAGILFAWEFILGVKNICWKYWDAARCCWGVFWRFCLATSSLKRMKIEVVYHRFVWYGNFWREFFWLSNHVGCWEATLKIFQQHLGAAGIYFWVLSGYVRKGGCHRVPSVAAVNKMPQCSFGGESNN